MLTFSKFSRFSLTFVKDLVEICLKIRMKLDADLDPDYNVRVCRSEALVSMIRHHIEHPDNMALKLTMIL